MLEKRFFDFSTIFLNFSGKKENQIDKHEKKDLIKQSQIHYEENEIKFSYRNK